jgi:catechol 2,3-dioxygenase-like lactoylglutathione lyase family enzyme
VVRYGVAEATRRGLQLHCGRADGGHKRESALGPYRGRNAGPTGYRRRVSDRAVPNLPSRDLNATSAFYQELGFSEVFHDPTWLILKRGDLQLEFFPRADLDVSGNWFSCCLRVSDLDTLYSAFRAAGVPERRRGQPSLQPITQQPWGQRMATLLDPDGTLLRLIEDGATENEEPG